LKKTAHRLRSGQIITLFSRLAIFIFLSFLAFLAFPAFLANSRSEFPCALSPEPWDLLLSILARPRIKNNPVSYLSTSVDDLVYGLSVEDCPYADSRWAENPFNDETVAGIGESELIAIQNVVEKSSKVSTPAVSGALLFATGQEGKKGEGLF
jgi:hypothetical protein